MMDLLMPFHNRGSHMSVVGPRGTEGTSAWPDWLTEDHPAFQAAKPFIERHETHESHGCLSYVPPFLDSEHGLIRFKWYCHPCWLKAEPQEDWTVNIGLLRDWGLRAAFQDPEYYCAFDLLESEAP